MNRRDFNSIVVGGLAATLIPSRWRFAQADLRVNGERLNRHLVALSQFGENPQGGVSRVAYTVADRAARTAVMEWMRAAQLEPSIDFAGNIIGRRAGRDGADVGFTMRSAVTRSLDSVAAGRVSRRRAFHHWKSGFQTRK